MVVACGGVGALMFLIEGMITVCVCVCPVIDVCWLGIPSSIDPVSHS